MHVFKVKNVAILKMFLFLVFSWLVNLSVEGTKCEINKECNLYCSKGATIKVASTKCKILNDVSLTYTNIDEIPKLKPFSITYLILKSNDIQHISRGIKELKIEKLYLNDNAITELKTGMFEEKQSFRIVWLENNQINVLQRKSIPMAHYLYLNNNLIKSLNADMFINIFYVQYLYLDNNRLKKITASSLMGLKAITLELSRNQLEDFEGMRMLKDLSLTNNLISSLEINSIPKVKNLNLSYNLLTSIEANMFSDVYYLKSLDITYNCIKETDLKLMEKVLILNRKFNEKCMLNSNHITQMDIVLILNSAVFVILVIAAIVITVYTRRCTKFSKHLTNPDTPDTPNAQLSYDRVTNAVYMENDGGYVEATNVYEEINDIAVQRESNGYLVPPSVPRIL
ncbi:PREDICTED: carboxypeptidase N subunit 2-like isoform X2 [Nicrophorus vespilloides]|uniref:Carboxypeptidase N subunit 2-like isoform X2 n=1 Tax=Nicrophorus vespilloides TaxID=110193 RepID=A0ABM1N812_NICVS|nr:PREDICTED: carboxypeptidase N subunit 2-like isoform X2 [Nicrophorus vespilloides]